MDTAFTDKSDAKRDRLPYVITGESVGYAGGFGLLYHIWYKDASSSNFHFFNDNPEWLQLDKTGHIWAGYHISQAASGLLQWAGVEKTRADWIGVGQSAFFLTTMEVLDGFGKEWGFSWGDALANTMGQALFLGQEKLWHEQRVSIKFFAHHTPYAQYRPNLLGTQPIERLLKDYNGQTYWLSINPRSFIDKEWIPPWIDISFGYGGVGMISGREGDEGIYQGVETFDRYRRYFLSLDLNVEKLNIKRKWVKAVLSPFRVIKFPFPALMIDKYGLHGYYYFHVDGTHP